MITITRRSLSVSRALHVLNSCVLCLAPPPVDLLVALETGSLMLLFAYIALLLLVLPFSFFLGVGAPSLSLAGFVIKAKAVQRGSLSFSWFVIASAACVYETGMLLVCACRTSAASVEPLPIGVRAPSLSLGRFMNSKLLDVAHCSVRCCIKDQLFCFGFIGANSNSMNSIRRAASSLLRLLRRCSCCESTHHRR